MPDLSDISLDHKLFDHTILKPDATRAAVDKVIDEALKYGFASVCVNSYYAAYTAGRLKGSDVATCCVVGFPLGQMCTRAKAYEASCAVSDGAQEIDMVINIAALKDGDHETVSADIEAVKKACGEKAILKVIIETCLLTDDEKVKACELSVAAGADFVKTSTGFSTGGAAAYDVALMRKTVGPSVGVKASGGIRDKETALEMIKAGASRLGTSATVAIIGED